MGGLRELHMQLLHYVGGSRSGGGGGIVVVVVINMVGGRRAGSERTGGDDGRGRETNKYRMGSWWEAISLLYRITEKAES